jgi:hypothetical protein
MHQAACSSVLTEQKNPSIGQGYVTVMRKKIFTGYISKEQGLTVNHGPGILVFSSSYDQRN